MVQIYDVERSLLLAEYFGCLMQLRLKDIHFILCWPHVTLLFGMVLLHVALISGQTAASIVRKN